MNKRTLIALILGIGFILAALIFASGNSSNSSRANNVHMENGTQIVEISAKGGYTPRVSYAKAGIATTLRVETRGTFDCSSSLVVPAVGFRANLPPTGVTNVELPPQIAGSVMHGICGMGMYNFEVHFD